MAEDILFRTDNFIFSYRVAGILIIDNKILLQKQTDKDGFAFPGGHVAFGETNAETLIREFKEETNFNITVGELKWVGEMFFPWDKKQCHQICLYYSVNLENTTVIKSFDKFTGNEYIENRNFDIEFHWMPIEKINKIKIYPANTIELLKDYDKGVKHFVDKEEK
ncbi:MAG: NUDIX domain-containing protein [Termitinemataceae bacterium]|nr:MAG: NUDIX domain-containing protein [Termitinemataceae bacterium]